jgi:O-antigen ligase
MNAVFRKDNQTQALPGFLFGLYIYFIVDFFLHLSARIPAYGMLRPTLVLVVLITVLLFVYKDRFKGISEEPSFRSLKWLIIFILVTIPLVTWPGSVLKDNIPLFVKAVVFFYFTALIVDTEKRLKILLFVFIACQIFRVLEPLYLNITDGYWGDRTYLGSGEFAQRLSGAPSDIVNPNGLGFVIVTIVPYLYYLVWGSGRNVHRLIFLLLMPLLVYALVLTMSRGAFLALCVVMWMVFKESRHKIFLVLIIVSSMAGVWVNLSADHKDRYMSLFSSSSKQSASAEGRWRGMLNEFEIALDRPIVGHGLGTTAESKVHTGHRYQAAHNLYAEILIEIGIIGFILFMRFLQSIYNLFHANRNSIKGSKLDEKESYYKTFEYRLTSAFVAIFWMYVVYSINYWGLSVYYWYFFGGLILAFSRIYFPDFSVKKGTLHARY